MQSNQLSLQTQGWTEHATKTTCRQHNELQLLTLHSSSTEQTEILCVWKQTTRTPMSTWPQACSHFTFRIPKELEHFIQFCTSLKGSTMEGSCIIYLVFASALSRIQVFPLLQYHASSKRQPRAVFITLLPVRTMKATFLVPILFQAPTITLLSLQLSAAFFNLW